MKKWQPREVGMAWGWCVSRPPVVPMPGRRLRGGRCPSPHTGSPLCRQALRTRLTQTIGQGQALCPVRLQVPSLPLLALRPPCPGVRWKPACPDCDGAGSRGSGEGTRRGMKGSGAGGLHLCALGCGCLCMCSRCAYLCVHIHVHMFTCDCVRVCSQKVGWSKGNTSWATVLL